MRSVLAHPGGEKDVVDWIEERAAAGGYRVDRIPFKEMDGWAFAEGTGDLVHRSGRFFRVRGLHVRSDGGDLDEWYQPIIDQPEIGILGILAKEFDGLLHFLMQAKMEPGNPEPIQLSPTVQATRSNITGVHGGRTVRHLEHFVRPDPGRVLLDVLQSEHGSWFFRKSNRNMIVEIEPDQEVEDHPDFRWFSLGALGDLLRLDNTVNMDARSVLACMPAYSNESLALHTDTELRSWFTEERFRHAIRAEPVPLGSIPDWIRENDRIRHRHARYFDVVAVSASAGSREVRGWTQPLIQPVGKGVIAFLTRRIGGIPHLLVQARPEGGLPGALELAPTVQCTPENYAHLPSGARPPFLDTVMSAQGAPVLYKAVHTEEGGRFRNAANTHMVVRVDSDPALLPPGYLWVTPDQLGSLLQHGYYVNVQARNLLACVNTGAVVL